jgi:hypothetical protein
MASGDLVPEDRVIYRALGKKYLNEASTAPNEVAFLLKPAHGDWPDETFLSFGVSPEAARKGLTRIRHVCEIKVADILALQRGLQVTEDDDPEKVRVSGMPLETENPKLAFDIAKDLLGKSKLCS